MDGSVPGNQVASSNGGNGGGEPAPDVRRVRFGAFELNLHTGELRKGGLKVRLQDKPFQILTLLLGQPGQLVTREEIQKRLWPSDTFVDFDRNLNTATNRLRQALGDSADNPRFVETIPRRGYRLIVPVEELPGSVPAEGPQRNENESAAEASASPEARVPQRFMRVESSWHSAWVAAALVCVLALAYWVWSAMDPAKTAGVRRPMLVVLPFENLSGDAEQEYLSDGLTDEMITQLSRLNPGRLGVIGRTSSMRYKGLHKPVKEIAGELDVDYALEGSVRVAEGRLRVNAQLVNARDQSTLWTDTYERDLADILSVQRDVAGRIAGALAVELLPAQRRALSVLPTTNPEAYEAYLLGRFYWSKRDKGSLGKALESFHRAMEKDPQFAAAYAGLADTYIVMSSRFIIPPNEAYPQAKAAVQKALELDPNLAEAHASLGAISSAYDWDWVAAERSYRRAIELNPGYATAHQWYAEYLSSMGRHAEALAEIERARSLDPLSLIIGTSRGNVFFYARRYDDALQACRATLAMDPNFVPARILISMVYVQKNMHREAVAERTRAMIPEGYAKEEAEAFWRAYAEGGINGARRWLIEYRNQRYNTQYIPPYYQAVHYAAMGETDKAFEWLERGYQQRDVFLIRLRVDPNVDSLRADPRFADLLRRVNLPGE